MTATKSPVPAARQRILDTASRLFYRHGFQAVGIDTIVAESGVAKMTLYRHFPSKEHLIVAYLERANQQFWQWIEAEIADISDPGARLLAIFGAVAKLTTSTHCLGCAFQTTAAEFPALEHGAHQAALAHKVAVRERLHALASVAGLRNPDQLANQLLLLMDGAWVAARMFGPDNPAADLVAAAQSLIAAHHQAD